MKTLTLALLVLSISSFTSLSTFAGTTMHQTNKDAKKSNRAEFQKARSECLVENHALKGHALKECITKKQENSAK